MMWKIKKFFLNIFARFALPSFIFNYSADKELDKLFWAASQNKLTDVQETYAHITFTALGMKFTVWDENRWYAWLHQGVVWRDNKIVYRWSAGRPSVYVMWVFRNHLKRFRPAASINTVDGLLYEAAVDHKDGAA